jgi:hypothetical protein
VYDLGDEGIFLFVGGVGFDLGEEKGVAVLNDAFGQASD